MSSPVIAVIEDNEDNRHLMHALLSDRYELREYPTGIEALEALRGFVPDLILMDISLPGMDGVQVLEYLHREPRLRQVPVIALTAHAMTGDREQLLEAGFDEYVAKPIVDEEILFEAIERLLVRET